MNTPIAGKNTHQRPAGWLTKRQILNWFSLTETQLLRLTRLNSTIRAADGGPWIKKQGSNKRAPCLYDGDTVARLLGYDRCNINDIDEGRELTVAEKYLGESVPEDGAEY